MSSSVGEGKPPPESLPAACPSDESLPAACPSDESLPAACPSDESLPAACPSETEADQNNPEPQRQNSVDLKRQCWVCFAGDEDDRDAPWVRPCRCRGTTKWVHQQCLQRWIDEKQKGSSTAAVLCPQCATEYLIVFPSLGPLVYVMDFADRVIYRVCPFIAGGVLVGSIYWTAVTYGAVTVMQVLGHKEGLTVMEQADPLFLLIGLPMIPTVLILSKMLRWEDYLLRLWRKHSAKLPLFSYIFGNDNVSHRVPADTMLFSDHYSTTRLLCGALMLPTVATVVGKFMYGSVQSNFQRTLLGGVAFIVMKGVLRIYFKQQQYLRQAQRHIRNYDEPEAPRGGATGQPASPPTPRGGATGQPASPPTRNTPLT